MPGCERGDRKEEQHGNDAHRNERGVDLGSNLSGGERAQFLQVEATYARDHRNDESCEREEEQERSHEHQDRWRL